jgi:hypothetical protein
MLTFDFALWLRASSLAYDPDIVVQREVDPLFTVEEAVLSLMRDVRETSVYKASVLTHPIWPVPALSALAAS